MQFFLQTQCPPSTPHPTEQEEKQMKEELMKYDKKYCTSSSGSIQQHLNFEYINSMTKIYIYIYKL